jgi:hypothetical protein
MSTSPEVTPVRPEDEIVSLLSQWLAFRSDTTELRAQLERIGTAGLGGEPADAVEELLAALASPAPGTGGDLERLVRETLDAVALGP